MDDPYWTSRENTLERIELSSVNYVTLVAACSSQESQSYLSFILTLASVIGSY